MPPLRHGPALLCSMRIVRHGASLRVRAVHHRESLSERRAQLVRAVLAARHGRTRDPFTGPTGGPGAEQRKKGVRRSLQVSTRRVAFEELLGGVISPVRVSFFEQSIGCETCAPTRQLLQQLVSGHSAITL